MEQLKQLLARLSRRQQITIAVAIIVVAGSLYWLSKWNKERDFKPLFTQLSAEDAGEALARIRESGIDYRLGENGTSILVPSARVAELRLQLASAGLPKSGRIGFELFDRTNFGATDFTEQVNFRRALEGELERSVGALAEVEQARVHITFPKESIYTESRQPAKASVLVKLRPGARLSQQNVMAVCHLTASAVEGLQPEAVSVLDMNGNLLNRPKRPSLQDGTEPSDEVIEYRQKLERDTAAKIASTLDPLLGPEKYRTGVSIDCDFTSGEQSEETFDPTKSVMVTSQRTEDGSSVATTSGVPGSASNLPPPSSRPVAGRGVGNTRRTENISYQSSRLVRHTKLPVGAVKRISVSVLLDHSVRYEKGRRILEPPAAEKIQIVKDLVAGIAGVQPDRGDQVIVESFPFDATLHSEPVVAPQTTAPATNVQWAPAWFQKLLGDRNFPILAGIAGAIVVVLFTGGAWLYSRARTKKKRAVSLNAQLPVRQGSKALAPAAEVEQQFEDKLAEHALINEREAQEMMKSLKLPAPKTKKTDVLIKHISEEARKDPVAMAQVVRSWLNTSDR